MDKIIDNYINLNKLNYEESIKTLDIIFKNNHDILKGYYLTTILDKYIFDDDDQKGDNISNLIKYFTKANIDRYELYSRLAEYNIKYFIEEDNTMPDFTRINQSVRMRIRIKHLLDEINKLFDNGIEFYIDDNVSINCDKEYLKDVIFFSVMNDFKSKSNVNNNRFDVLKMFPDISKDYFRNPLKLIDKYYIVNDIIICLMNRNLDFLKLWEIKKDNDLGNFRNLRNILIIHSIGKQLLIRNLSSSYLFNKLIDLLKEDENLDIFKMLFDETYTDGLSYYLDDNIMNNMMQYYNDNMEKVGEKLFNNGGNILIIPKEAIRIERPDNINNLYDNFEKMDIMYTQEEGNLTLKIYHNLIYKDGYDGRQDRFIIVEEDLNKKNFLVKYVWRAVQIHSYLIEEDKLNIFDKNDNFNYYETKCRYDVFPYVIKSYYTGKLDDRCHMSFQLWWHFPVIWHRILEEKISNGFNYIPIGIQYGIDLYIKLCIYLIYAGLGLLGIVVFLLLCGIFL